MKILCPVDGRDDVSRLAGLGASEFYGGILSTAWEERFSLVDASANRRSFPEAQIEGEERLGLIIETIHRQGGVFYLTLNSPFYLEEQIGLLLDIVGKAVGLGADAVILADIGLIRAVRERWPDLSLHLSTMAEVTNTAAADFYSRLGVDRITLPRHLSLAEIASLLEGRPEMRFDAFILYGQCVNAEGHCTFSHDHPRRTWPCVQPYRIEGRGRGKVPGRVPPLCSQMLWEGLPRGEACGLCALWDLRRLGLESVKIVGRGTGTGRKEWAVRTVASLLAFLEEEDPGKEEFTERARALYRLEFDRGCRPTLCYFPELMEENPVPGAGGRGM